MSGRFDVSDKEWAIIEPLLPNKPRGVPRVDDRRVLNGFGRQMIHWIICWPASLWVLRTGAPWQDMPSRYGPRTTVYNRFVRWRKKGVWAHILQHLQGDIEDVIYMIDSSVIRVHQHGAGARKKGGRRSRRQAAPVGA